MVVQPHHVLNKILKKGDMTCWSCGKPFYLNDNWINKGLSTHQVKCPYCRQEYEV